MSVAEEVQDRREDDLRYGRGGNRDLLSLRLKALAEAYRKQDRVLTRAALLDVAAAAMNGAAEIRKEPGF